MTRFRKSQNSLSLVYGLNSVEAILEKSPETISKVYFASKKKSPRLEKLIGLARQRGLKLEAVSDHELEQISRSFQHQGIAILARCPVPLGWSELRRLLEERESVPKKSVIILILDRIQDQNNLGAIIRTAAGFSVDALIISKSNSAPYTATTQRQSCGYGQNLPIITISNIPFLLLELKEKGFWVVGTACHGRSLSSIYQKKRQPFQKLVLVMGNEQEGMKDLIKKNCDEIIQIPLASGVDSLNVSVATGICLFAYKSLLQ